MSATRKNFTFIVAALMALAFTIGSAQALVIDTFETPQAQTANTGNPFDDSLIAGPGILGGDRELLAEWQSGDQDVQVEADAGGNSLLTFSTGASTLGIGRSIWRPIQTGGADLTDAGAQTGIAVGVIFDDLPVNLEFLIQGVGGSSIATLNLGGGIFAPTSEFLSFASFTGTVDFTQVNYITLRIIPLFPATDLQIDFIESSTPEPATLSLLALGSIGLLRRRKA